jgi:hypothetical protein
LSIFTIGNNFFLKNISNPSSVSIEQDIFNNNNEYVKSLRKKAPTKLNKIKTNRKEISKSL